MSMPIDKTCGECHFQIKSDNTPQPVCFRYPPKVALVPVSAASSIHNPNGQPIGMGTAQTRPLVPDDTLACGEFRKRIMKNEVSSDGRIMRSINDK